MEIAAVQWLARSLARHSRYNGARVVAYIFHCRWFTSQWHLIITCWNYISFYPRYDCDSFVRLRTAGHPRRHKRKPDCCWLANQTNFKLLQTPKPTVLDIWRWMRNETRGGCAKRNHAWMLEIWLKWNRFRFMNPFFALHHHHAVSQCMNGWMDVCVCAHPRSRVN